MSTTASRRPVASRTAIPGGLAAAVLGGTALAASNACFAILTADGAAEDSADYLRLVEGRPLLVEVGAALGLLACLFLVPAIWAVVGRLDEGRARLASVGGWLMSSGYVMGVALSVETLVVLSVSMSDLSPAGFVDAADHRTTVVATGMYAVFGLGALLGGLVLGVAMLRDRSVPRWCGVALVASEPVRVVGLLSGVHGLTAVASLLILASFVAVLRPRR